MAGFRPDEVPHVTRSEIVLCEEAKRLEQQPLLRAVIEARLQQVSGYSIAKDRRERRKKGQKAEDFALEREGAEIVAELREAMLFETMPHYQQAQHVARRGWPGERKENAVQVYAGVVPSAAAGLNRLRLEGKLLKLKSPWVAGFDDPEVWRRIMATAKQD